jgi:hypothetical protein
MGPASARRLQGEVEAQADARAARQAFRPPPSAT